MTARVVAVIAVLLLLLWLAKEAFGGHFVLSTIAYVVDNLASRSGLSPFLVRGVIILVTIPFFWAVAKFTGGVMGLLNLTWGGSLGIYDNKYGIVIVVYIAFFFGAMYWASLHAYAFKYCAETPEGTKVSDGPGKDPVYGVERTPCNFGQIEGIREIEGNLRAPQEIRVANMNTFQWFDGVTGRPLVWYVMRQDGDYKFFDRSGKDPNTGQVLQPITPEIVQQIRQQQKIKEEARKQRDADQAAKLARSKEFSDFQDLSTQAQVQFDAGDYKAAKETCDRVLIKDKGNAPCTTIRQHAYVKLAQELVKQGQSQLQRGEFNEAIWSAEKAIGMDPANTNAAKLKQLAVQLKPHALN